MRLMIAGRFQIFSLTSFMNFWDRELAQVR